MTVRPRPTRVLPYLLAFVLGAGVAVLSACGSSNPAMIPQQNANRLKSDLDEVVAAVDANDCGRADRALSQLGADYASLPARTSVRIKRRLKDALDKLGQQANKECVKTTDTQTTQTQTTETQTTETVPTTTTPTQTATTPPATTPPTDTTGTPTTTAPPTDTGAAPSSSGNGGTSGDGTLP